MSEAGFEHFGGEPFDPVWCGGAGSGGEGEYGRTAPQAGFGDIEFFPDRFVKAAVLVCRLAWNHPLPDGNKRAAWAALLLFIDFNNGVWDPDPPDIDEAEEAMLAIAAGDVGEAWTAQWLRERLRFEGDD